MKAEKIKKKEKNGQQRNQMEREKAVNMWLSLVKGSDGTGRHHSNIYTGVSARSAGNAREITETSRFSKP